MSYDIEFGVKVENVDKIMPFTAPEYASPTYNIGEMLRKATGWDFEQHKWYKVSDVFEKISKGHINLSKNKEEYRKYEPENKWGTVETAIKALQSILEKIEGIEKWFELTKDHFYIRW